MNIKGKIVDILYGLNEKWTVRQMAARCFHKIHRRKPDINGVRFTEKIYRRKVLDHNRLYVDLSDKVLVKQHVASILGPEWVVPTLWAGTDVSSVDLTRIPKPFVVKANHGSGWNLFVRSDAELDIPRIRQKCAQWLKQKYGRPVGEWSYFHIKPQILIEPFIGDSHELPIDYKIYVFSQKVEFIQVHTDRETICKQCFYDRDWNKQTFYCTPPLDERDIPKPDCLSAMITAAETLAEGFDFVRVDFYVVNGRPIFGEMTFFPGSGVQRFHPDAWDTRMGEYWKQTI